jgi:type IV secretory pathway VirD2 relaxase
VSQDDFDPRPARSQDGKGARPTGYARQVLRRVGAARRRSRLPLIPPGVCHRGQGTGARAAAGLMAPNCRRVVIKTRYTVIAGSLHAASLHMKYIVRDGVSRDGKGGRAYDAASDDADVRQFLRHSSNDRYQFRFLVSAEDGARLHDLRAFTRALMAQMQHDLDSNFDWIAVDHFNTGHPHTHIVVRGRDHKDKTLIIASDYLCHGLRARARALVSLELGPEGEMERLHKRINEVAQERFTDLDRSLLARAKDGVLAIAAIENGDPIGHTLRVGRLKTLQQLGLAQERQTGVWALGADLESRLHQLGERADKFKMMQRALKEAGIDRGAAALALFERGARKAPLLGRLVGVGSIDDITDRTWVVIDAVDGRIHYAELGRLKPVERPRQGDLVLLAAGAGAGKPSAAPKLHVLSVVELARQTSYEGPTWIDQALLANWQPDPEVAGFGAELRGAFAARLRWLRQRQLVIERDVGGDLAPTAEMMRSLRQLETQRLVQALSHELGANYVPREEGGRIHGIYERGIVTPTGRLALIRRQDTFTLAPWKPGLEAWRGRAVVGFMGPARVSWSLDRGRALPER